MAYLSPYHRQLLERRTPLNWFAAMLLRKDDEPPFPWSGKSEPMSEDFSAKSHANQWFQVHELIEVDPSSKTQRWIWSAKGRAYRELVRNSGVNNFSGLRDFPPVPEST